jgi:hypothetical protein
VSQTINAGATTTNNLLSIQGNRNMIVAVGATGSIIYSANSGRSWAAYHLNPRRRPNAFLAGG